MTYFVTGATGFIGRHLIQRLLEREGSIHVLVRASSMPKFEALLETWGEDAAERVHPVTGDIAMPRVGVGEDTVAELTGKIEHFVHLEAVYDMSDDADEYRVSKVV